MEGATRERRAGPLGPPKPTAAGVGELPAAGGRTASQHRPLRDREGEEGWAGCVQIKEGHGAGGGLAAGRSRWTSRGLKERGGGRGVERRGARGRGRGSGGGGRWGGEGQTEGFLHSPQEGDGDTRTTWWVVVAVVPLMMLLLVVVVVAMVVLVAPESLLDGALAGQFRGFAEK